MGSFLKLKEFFLTHKRYYIAGVSSLIVVNTAQLVMPKMIGNLTDLIASGDFVRGDLVRFVLLFLGLALLIAVFRYAWRINIMGTARKMEYTLRNMLFEHLQSLSTDFFNRNKTGDLMAHATNDIHAVRMAFGPGIVSAVDALFLTTVTIYMMAKTISLQLTLVALIPLPFMVGIGVGFGRLIHRRFRRVQEAFSLLTDRVQENFSGIRVIKGFARERREEERFEEVNELNVQRNMELVRIHALFHPLIGFCSSIAVVLILGYGGMLVLNGSITIGDFVAFYSYLGTLIWPIMAISWVINLIQRGKASMDRLNSIFYQKSEIENPQESALNRLEGRIEFENLTFSYPTSTEPVLQGITAEIAPGQVVGILGRTGSGKSTLLNLLLRLYDAKRGMIKLDGVDIQDISLEVLRRDIGYVPQESFLFSTTVKENIDFTATGSDLERVQEYAKIAQVYDNIMEFPQQFDTIVGERGVTLSGGQKQRIALARALIKEPQILILDDSFSAVDTETEEAILQNLRRVFPGKTVIIVSHRISTLKNANHILVLEEGSITQEGTHDQLTAEPGLYQELYQKQLLEEQIESVG
ncbi:MAG TPA: ABC transporter ATP-binding protein [Firmicutes bacterium]|nr:ABC transporter ATP-binding protein [Bacillota bacterium]